MILVDSNILLRWVVRSDPLCLPVRTTIRNLRASGEVLCIVPQNLYEFWAVATRPRSGNGIGLSIAGCRIRMARIRRFFHFLPDEPALFDEWEHLVTTHQCHGRVSYDARLVAAMNIHGLTRLMTLNVSDFARFPGLTLIDPTSGSQAPLSPRP